MVIIGNLDQFSRVDGRDLTIMGHSFGSRPSDSNWNQKADFDRTGASYERIDGQDLAQLAIRFGRSSIGALNTPEHRMQNASVRLIPSIDRVAVGQEFTVSVYVENVSDLFAFGFDIETRFEILDVACGDFLADKNRLFLVSPDRRTVDVARTGEGVSGAGVVAIITLQAEDTGDTKILLLRY